MYIVDTKPRGIVGWRESIRQDSNRGREIAWAPLLQHSSRHFSRAPCENAQKFPPGARVKDASCASLFPWPAPPHLPPVRELIPRLDFCRHRMAGATRESPSCSRRASNKGREKTRRCRLGLNLRLLYSRLNGHNKRNVKQSTRKTMGKHRGRALAAENVRSSYCSVQSKKRSTFNARDRAWLQLL